MGELITKILELFILGNKKAILKLSIFGLLVVIILPIGLDYFYANIKIEQRELININPEYVSDVRLLEYHERILNSLSKNEKSLLEISIINDRPQLLIDYFETKNIIKFLSGSSVWILLFIICLFSKQKTLSLKVSVQILLAIIIFIFGIIGIHIPSFSIFAINVIVFPLTQIAIIVVIVVLTSNTKNKGKVKNKGAEL